MLRQTSHSKNNRHNQHNIPNCIRYFRVCLFYFHLNIFLNFKYIRFSSSANYTFFGCSVFRCVRATVLLWLFVWLILIWFNLQAHGDEKGFNLAKNVNETNFICRLNGQNKMELNSLNGVCAPHTYDDDTYHFYSVLSFVTPTWLSSARAKHSFSLN